MSRASSRAGWIALVAAVASLTALFFLSCERRSIEIPRGYSGEAARNPYLAAQRLLERLGTSVRSFPDLSSMPELPPTDTLLIVPTARRSLSEARAKELLHWVEGGGHLLVVTWQLFDDPKREPDFVLDPLGVRQFLNEFEDDEPGEDLEEPDQGEPGEEVDPEAPENENESPLIQTSAPDEEDEEPEVELALAEFPGRATPLRVEFDPEYRLELGETATRSLDFDLGDANGVHLVILHLGQGLVTALTDDYFLTQPTIADWDHAELVYRLAHWGGESRAVWIVIGDAYPGALALVWRYGWMVIASALLVLALWLWSASQRFGPIAPDPTLERREWMEHVRAAGRFQWRRGAAPALLTAARDALLARMRERHPSFVGLMPAEQAERLASLSGVPAERVLAALSFRNDTEASRFAADIAVLEKIRRSL